MKNTVLSKNVIILDVMLKGSFVCQVKMPYCPLFPLDMKEARKYVAEKKPTLKGKEYVVEVSNAMPLFKNDANVVL